MMLTITADFLKLCPAWKKAGWKENDVVNLASLSVTALQALNAHPPHKPGT